MAAQPIVHELKTHIDQVKALHHRDLEEGFGEVYIPDALGRKYKNAAMETQWQYVFPSKKRSIDPRRGNERRHHVMESGLQKAVKRAAQKAGIDKRVTCHTLRHSFATTMLENGINIRVLQELLDQAYLMADPLQQLISNLEKITEILFSEVVRLHYYVNSVCFLEDALICFKQEKFHDSGRCDELQL
ncbi:MAG: tyrosine-type recombinase/integrase [Desulfobacterium sp.]